MIESLHCTPSPFSTNSMKDSVSVHRKLVDDNWTLLNGFDVPVFVPFLSTRLTDDVDDDKWVAQIAFPTLSLSL